MNKWEKYKAQLLEGYKVLSKQNSIGDKAWCREVEKVLEVMGDNPNNEMIKEYFSTPRGEWNKKYATN